MEQITRRIAAFSLGLLLEEVQRRGGYVAGPATDDATTGDEESPTVQGGRVSFDWTSSGLCLSLSDTAPQPPNWEEAPGLTLCFSDVTLRKVGGKTSPKFTLALKDGSPVFTEQQEFELQPDMKLPWVAKLLESSAPWREFLQSGSSEIPLGQMIVLVGDYTSYSIENPSQ